MEVQIAKQGSAQRTWPIVLGELLVVFLPTLLFLMSTNHWVGDDPTRSFVIAWIGNIFMLTMIWAMIKRRRRSWKEMGLTFSLAGSKDALVVFSLSLLVFVLGVCAWFIGPLLLPDFLEAHGSADFTRYEYLKDNLGALILSLLGVYIVSSFGEEVIYRGFLITHIMELARGMKYNNVIAVLLSSVIFGLIHYEWGTMGMIQTGIFGVVMGTCYILLKKRLWILILAHAYMDTILFVQLYMVSNQ